MPNPQYLWFEGFDHGPGGWSVSGPATISVDSTISYSGGSSLRINVANGGGGATTVTLSKQVQLGPEAVSNPGLYIDHKAMIRPSATPSGLSVQFDSLGGTQAGSQPLAAGSWSWVKGGRQASVGGEVMALLVFSIPAGASLSLWVDWIRFEVRHTPTLTPQGEAVILPFSPDASESVVDTWEYVTDVIVADDGSEARQALRERPRRFLTYRLLELGGSDAARLNALLHSNLRGRWLVPYWPGVRRISAVGGSAPVSQQFSVDTEAAEFSVGERVMVWGSHDQFDLMNITQVLPGRVDAVGVQTFPRLPGMMLVPVHPGVIPDDARVNRESPLSMSSTLSFELETHWNEPPSPAGVALYRGGPLVSLAPHGEALPVEDWSQAYSRVGGATGSFLLRTQHPDPVASRTLQWILDGLGEIASMKGLIALLRGRRNGFWLPTFRGDLELAQNAAEGSTQLVIRESGYTALMFPREARRHLALFSADRQVQAARVLSAVAAGGVETLTLDAPLARAIPMGAGRVSFLLWSRMASDFVAITSYTPRVATVSMDVTELPREVP